MAITEKRIQTIETAITDIRAQLALIVGKLQFNQLSLVTQQDINALDKRLTTVESEIKILNLK